MKYDLDFIHKMVSEHKKAARECWPDGEYIYPVDGRSVPLDAWWSQHPCQEPTVSDKERKYIKVSDHIDKVWQGGFREIGWKPTDEEDEADDWYFLD